MNKLIQELAAKAGFMTGGDEREDAALEEFAKLIANECANACFDCGRIYSAQALVNMRFEEEIVK